MTTQEYRAHPALNFSAAKHLLDSPAHFQAYLEEPKEVSTAMNVGTIAHALILEGRNLLDQYAIRPSGMSFVSKEGRAWKDAQTLPIISVEDAVAVARMADAISSNADASHILKQCQHREMPIFATVMGVECKALLDCCGTDGKDWVIADLKTCQDSSQRGFSATVAKFHYDLQAAWYSSILATIHGLESPPYWIWLAVEKLPPFANVVWTAENWIESGQNKMEIVLQRYKECTASGKWPLPITGIHKLEKPSWA